MLAFITYEHIYTLDEQRTRFAYGQPLALLLGTHAPNNF